MNKISHVHIKMVTNSIAAKLVFEYAHNSVGMM